MTIWFDELRHSDDPVAEERLFKATVELKLELPDTPKVFKLVLPDTFNPFNAPNPVIDPPTPTLQVVVKVLALMFVAFNACRLDNPVTFRVFNAAAEVVVSDPPTATLPVVVKVEALMFVALSAARLLSPDTFNPFNAPNPVIDPPTPTLQVVV